jgi:hypothetical protein
MAQPFPRLVFAVLAFVGLSAAGLNPGARAASKEELEIARRITAAQMPLDKLPEAYRQKVTDIVDQSATVYSRSPATAFPCKPAVYHWLVDNPQCGFRAWKVLGTKCATVEKKEDGSYFGKDQAGSEFHVHTVFEEPGRRIWYAEGTAKATAVSSPVPVRAVLVLRYQEVKGVDGRIGIRHRAELFTQAEAKTTGLMGKLWGMSADVLATKAAEQVDLFFSGIAWYMSEHPEWTKTALQPTAATAAEEAKQVEMLFKTFERP